MLLTLVYATGLLFRPQERIARGRRLARGAGPRPTGHRRTLRNRHGVTRSLDSSARIGCNSPQVPHGREPTTWRTRPIPRGHSGSAAVCHDDLSVGEAFHGCIAPARSLQLNTKNAWPPSMIWWRLETYDQPDAEAVHAQFNRVVDAWPRSSPPWPSMRPAARKLGWSLTQPWGGTACCQSPMASRPRATMSGSGSPTTSRSLSS